MTEGITHALGALIVAALSFGLAASPAAANEAELYAAAKKEGQVNFYTGLLQNQLIRPMVAAFEAKYPGVKVTVAGGISADLTLKILAEAKAGVFKADLNTPARIDELDKAGLIASYHPIAAKNYPAELKSPDGKWTALVRYFYGLSANTELVKEKDIPQTLDDLLDPRWKGKIAWVAGLGAGGPPVFTAAVLDRLGDEKGKAYLRKLAQQGMVKIPSNQRVVLDQVIAGQFPLALMAFHHHAFISVQKGAPVKWVPFDPVISTTDSLVLLKNAPNPNAAKLFLEFMLSPEGAKIVSEANYVPASPDVKPLVPLVPESTAKLPPMVFPPTRLDANMDKWIATYLELFQ